MSNRSSPGSVKKTGLDNGNDEGANEDSTCLPSNSRGGTFNNVFSNTVLSSGARIAVIVLIVLCVALLIVVITLAVFWPGSSYRHERCTTPPCLRLAATYTEWMDPMAQPCIDPHRWACGGWVDQNINRSHWSLKDDIRLQELILLRDIITTSTVTDGFLSLDWKVKTFYESCMAMDHIEGEAERPLQAMITRLGGWRVQKNWSALSWSWRDVLEKLHSQYGATPFFDISIVNYQGNRTMLHVEPAGLGLPDRSYYYDNNNSEPVVAYKLLLQDVAFMLGVPKFDAEVFASDVFAYEQRLARMISDSKDYLDIERRVMTLNELKAVAEFVPLQNILKAMFPKVTLSNSTEILVSSVFYFSHLSMATTGTDSRILNDYFMWTLTRQYLPYMSHKYRSAWTEFQSHITGDRREKPRWEFCSALLRKIAPLATTSMLENTRLIDGNSSVLNTVYKMFTDIQELAIQKIDQSAIITEDMKETMIQQVKKLTLEIGLNENEINNEFLNEYHNSLSVQIDDFFKSVGYGYDFAREIVRESLIDQNINNLRVKSKALSEGDILFNSFSHTIIVPTVLLSSPYFDIDYPKPIQYGRLAFSLSEAIGEALAVIDTVVINSNVPLYAVPAVQCFTRAISKQQNGTLHTSLLPFAYKHLLGASLAIEALSTETEEVEKIFLPGMEDLNRMQLFTLAYAQTLCTVENSHRIQSDLRKLHINGETLLNTIWHEMKVTRNSLGCSKLQGCPAVL